MFDSLKSHILCWLREAITRIFQNFRISAFKFASTNQLCGVGFRILQPVHALGSGTITIGKKVVIGFHPSPGYFSDYCHIEARAPSASIAIGEHTYINNAFTAIAETHSIEIGSHCFIGPRVTIFDSDFHPLIAEDRRASRAPLRKPVKIGDHVFIGAGAVILKGVSIGSGAVIGAGAVVVSDVPANVVAAGNPAEIVKRL